MWIIDLLTKYSTRREHIDATCEHREVKDENLHLSIILIKGKSKEKKTCWSG